MIAASVRRYFSCYRKRYVYVVHAPKGPGLSAPMIVDATGTCVRREGLGGMYLTYGSPPDKVRAHFHAILGKNLDFLKFGKFVTKTFRGI